MPQIRKIGSVWYSDIRIAGKRIRSPLSTDKQIALEKLQHLRDQKETSKYGPSSSVSWKDFLTRYIAYSEGSKAESTAIRDKAAIAALERFRMPARLLDVTPEYLEGWKAARRAAGRGNATINRDIKAIKAMMRRAKIWGYIREWDGSSVSPLKETRGRLLFYTMQELRRLLSVCDSRMSGYYDWTTICLLGARAGLRRSEIYWLSWKDVDLKRGLISITPKAGWQPKTGEQRHIPIPADLKKHLLSRLPNKKTKLDECWVIGERPSLSVMSAFFQKISRKAKLSGNIHTLRHTYASHLVQSGVELYSVSKLLGHSSMRMTEIYAHLAPSTLRDAVLKLPKL